MTQKHTSMLHHWDDSEQTTPPGLPRFVEVYWDFEQYGFPEPVFVSRQLRDVLFATEGDPYGTQNDSVQFLSPETKELYAETALLLTAAIAANARVNFPITVELPVIEGVTESKTMIKVFHLDQQFSELGFLVVTLSDEEGPLPFEMTVLQESAYGPCDVDWWEDV